MSYEINVFARQFISFILFYNLKSILLTLHSSRVIWIYSSGFPGYGYFQATTAPQPAPAAVAPVPTSQTNGVHSILQQPLSNCSISSERQVNGSSYYEYSTTATHAQQIQPITCRTTDTTNTAVNNFANIRDTSGYGRNGTSEVQLAGPMTSQITPGTNTTPALVAQALSGT